MKNANSLSHRTIAPGIPFSQHPWWVFFGLILAGLLMVPIDVPLSVFCHTKGLPGELSRLLDRSEFFGHVYGVLGIAMTIYVIDVARRRQLVRLLTCSLGAGLMVDMIKGLVHRTRPCDFDTQLSVVQSFKGLSFSNAESFDQVFSSANTSLPSAHTAVAVGLALTLGWMYPLGRRWFLIVACLVGASRVDGGAHFASDVFWGAAVGYLVGYLCLADTRWACRFTRWESQGTSLPTACDDDTNRRAA